MSTPSDRILEELETHRDNDSFYMGWLFAAAVAEIRRLRSGDFTADEIHNFCHESTEIVTAEQFADGCTAYQRKLYGCAPVADRLATLLRERSKGPKCQ